MQRVVVVVAFKIHTSRWEMHSWLYFSTHIILNCASLFIYCLWTNVSVHFYECDDVLIVIGTQVLYNAAAVYSRMGHWDRAEETLVSIGQERAGSRTAAIEAALESIQVRRTAFCAQHHIRSVSVSI